MATNGKLTKTIRNDLNIYISWNAVQNVTGNYSDVTATLYINRQYAMYSSGSGKITLDGTTKSGTYDISTSSGGTYSVVSIEKRITHSSDGKASVKLGGSVDFNGTSLSGTVLNNITIPTETITLNDIKRLSTSNASNFTLDSGTTITVNQYLSGSVDVAIFANNSLIKGYTDVSSKVSLSFTSSELSKIYELSKTSTTVQIKIRTNSYNSSGTYIGVTYKTVNGYIPSSIKPSVGSITVVDTNKKNPNPDTLLQYVSLWKLSTSYAIAGESASVKEIKWELKNDSGATFYTATGNNIVTPGFNQHGYINVKAIVTDSRGRSTSRSTTVYLSYYRSPSISKASAIRTDYLGDLNPSGTWVTVNADIKGATVSGENEISVKLFKKSPSSYSYPSLPYYKTTITSLSWSAVHSFEKTSSGIDISTPYDIKLEVSDNYSTAVWEGQLPTAYIPIAFSNSGVGIGGFPTESEDARLQIFGDASFEKKLKPMGGIQKIRGVLKSGWTGDLYYQKDGFGNAHIWGSIIPGTFKNWTTICDLGQDYANNNYLTAIPSINTNSSKGSRGTVNLYISETGALKLVSTSGAYSDDTFTFNVSYHTDGGW